MVIEKSLPKTSYWFLKVLANELYGENVSAQRDIFGEPASSVIRIKPDYYYQEVLQCEF